MTPALEQPKRKRVPMQQPVGACDCTEMGRPPCGRRAEEWTGFFALSTQCMDEMEKEAKHGQH